MPRSGNIIVALIAAGALILCWSNDPAAVSAPAKNKKKKNVPVVISGGSVKGALQGIVGGKKMYQTELGGNPEITWGQMRLSTGRIVVRGAQGDTAECTGGVRISDGKTKSTIRASRALFTRKDNHIELTGGVEITTRRSDDGSTVLMRSKRVIYRINDEVAEALGGVRVTNADILIVSERAVYRKRENVVSFEIKPIAKKGPNIFRAATLSYELGERRIVLDGNVYIETYTDEKDAKTGAPRRVRSITTGDRAEYLDAAERRVTVLGNARIVRDDATFAGKRIDMLGKDGDRVLGDDIVITYTAEHVDVKGKRLSYNKANKYASISGDSVIIIRDPKVPGKEKARMYGDYIEYFQDIEELFINGNVSIHQDNGVIRGDVARYLRREDAVYIMGNSRIERAGSTLTANMIYFNTKSNNVRLIGNIYGTGVN